ncbi:MAG TPA: tetratricopeptide repeat protein [Chitinophagales bacterium]|nr:tetratricopeptide repeat protein [Chitinophagales bacterium]
MSSKKQKKENKKVVQHPTAAIKNSSQEKLTRVLAIIVGAVAVIEYIQTLSYSFVLDDYSSIIENSVTQGGFHSIPTIFKTTYRFGYAIQGDDLYRPIPKSVFAILWQLFPNNPFPGHLLNVLLYAITGILLFTVLTKFLPLRQESSGQKIYLAFIAALLFVAHPIHTEAVANIKSMDEILSFFFFVISLFWLQKFLETDRKRWMMLAAISYFASLLSKESAITCLAIYPLAIFFFTKKSIAKNFQISGLMLIAAVIFLIIRYRIVGATAPPNMADNALLGAKDFLTQKASAIFMLGLYLKLLVFPYPLTFDYSYNQIPLVGAGDWKFWISAIIYASLLVIALWRWKKKDLIAFGILFFLVTISISSNLFILIGTHMAERLLYVPSFGFCFAIAVVLERFIQKNTVLKADSLKSFFLNRAVLSSIAGAIILLYSLQTWSQNPVWKNNLALDESGVLRSPDSHRTHFYLGNSLLKKEYYSKFSDAEQKQIIQRGINELRKSVTIYPEFGDAWLQIGNYFSGIHQNDSAIYYFQKTLQLEPYLATAHNNLGTVYFDQKQYDKAIASFTDALRYDPNYHDAYRNLGSVYGTIGRFQEAIPYFMKSLAIAPADGETCYYLGVTYKSLGDMQNSKFYLDKAAELDPRFKK